MRYYFFSDIHGNMAALKRCTAHIDGNRVDEAYCMGDIVGWLPFGDRTLEYMRSLSLPTVAGNHDLLVAGLFGDHPHQIDRMQASAYNAGLIASIPGASDYLLQLPLAIEKNDLFTVVHHSPFHLPQPGDPLTIQCFNYLDEKAIEGCLFQWQSHPKRLIFSGHDHIPAIYELPDTITTSKIADMIVHRPGLTESFTVRLNPCSRYWIKVGSVGGPYRDGIAVANSAIYDSTEEAVTLYRLKYPTQVLCCELMSNLYFRNIPTIQRYIEMLKERNAIRSDA
jgi:predicted phosphodiesterase